MAQSVKYLSTHGQNQERWTQLQKLCYPALCRESRHEAPEVNWTANLAESVFSSLFERRRHSKSKVDKRERDT